MCAVVEVKQQSSYIRRRVGLEQLECYFAVLCGGFFCFVFWGLFSMRADDALAGWLWFWLGFGRHIVALRLSRVSQGGF